MRVTVRTFASLRELSMDRCELALADGATASDAWDALAAQFAAIEPHRPYVRVARNGAYAGWDVGLADGDELAFLPPVSGGSGSLTTEPIDVAALERPIADLGHGAVVTFVGRARRTADDGREVTELEYEVYPEMAASVLADIAAEAEDRWGVAVGIGRAHV